MRERNDGYIQAFQLGACYPLLGGERERERLLNIQIVSILNSIII